MRMLGAVESVTASHCFALRTVGVLCCVRLHSRHSRISPVKEDETGSSSASGSAVQRNTS